MRSPPDAQVLDTAVIAGFDFRLERWPEPRLPDCPPSVDHFCIIDDFGTLYAFHAEGPAWRHWAVMLKREQPIARRRLAA